MHVMTLNVVPPLLPEELIFRQGAVRSGRLWELVPCAASLGHRRDQQQLGRALPCVVTTCCVTSGTLLLVLPREQPWGQRHHEVLCLARAISPHPLRSWGAAGSFWGSFWAGLFLE